MLVKTPLFNCIVLNGTTSNEAHSHSQPQPFTKEKRVWGASFWDSMKQSQPFDYERAFESLPVFGWASLGLGLLFLLLASAQSLHLGLSS